MTVQHTLSVTFTDGRVVNLQVSGRPVLRQIQRVIAKCQKKRAPFVVGQDGVEKVRGIVASVIVS